MRRALACALILISLFSCTEGTPRKTTRTPGPSPSATISQPAQTSQPAPAGLSVIDSSWVSETVGWVLGNGTCGTASCASLKATTDGGRTWRTVATPGGPPASWLNEECQAPCISHIRFADRKIGYAFGPGFYVTRDGARTWQSERAPLVVNLEISRRRVFRVVTPMTGCPGPCDVRIEVSDAGSRTWQRLSTPRQDAGRPELAVQGDRVYFAAHGNPAGGAEDAHSRLMRSLDGGRMWRSFPDPCGFGPDGENDAVSFAAGPPAFLAVLCRSRMTSLAFILRSFDSGRSFGDRRPLPNGAAQIIALGSSQTLLVTNIRGASFQALVTRDGGGTWRETLSIPVREGDAGVWLADFQSKRTARVAFGSPSIWTTRDGGASWARSDPF